MSSWALRRPWLPFGAFGKPLGETLTLPPAEGALGTTYTLSHTYSAINGQLYRDTYPASPGGGALPAETVGHGTTTGYDLPATLNGLAQYAQETDYTALSQVAREVIGSTINNASITNTYDPHTGALQDSQVTNTAVSATPFDDTSYAYDPAGNITSQADVRNGTATEVQCFSYDTLDRLTQAWTTGGTLACPAGPAAGSGGTVSDGIPGGAYWTSWTFSPLGDRTSQTQHSLAGGTDTVTTYTYTYTYSYNGNGAGQPDTLTSTSATGPGAGAASYTYDAAGQTLTRNVAGGSQKLTWTDDGKVAAAATSAGTTSYVYDADGGLLLQKAPGQTTLYAFGGAEQIVLDTSTGAVTGTRFLALPGGTVVRTGAGSAYWFETGDQHGTSLLALDSTAANPVWRQFDPYGKRGAAHGDLAVHRPSGCLLSALTLPMPGPGCPSPMAEWAAHRAQLAPCRPPRRQTGQYGR